HRADERSVRQRPPFPQPTTPLEQRMILGLRTVIYHVPDLERATAWYSSVFGVQPYFDEPFYVGFNVGGYELGLDPDTTRVRPGVAIDGRSGSGKSTVAEAVARAIDAVIVPCDDFFAAGVSDAEWDRRTPAQRAADAIDWRRLKREALEPLRTGRPARWHAFDFSAGPRRDGTYPLQRTPTERGPKPVVLLDGAYSARPELADVVDLTVLVEAAPTTRETRLAAREATD